ncbi:MAG: hypothetical protein QCH35_05785 [Methanomicrobiaceae archaeon]|nr:hypothetical protein [Methanomicrobiaceae archaeon]
MEEEVKNMRTNDYKLPLAVGALLILAVVAVAPAWAASVDPVEVDGNPTCGDICPCDPACVQIAKFEADPQEGEVGIADPATDGGVTISNITYKEGEEPMSFDWVSTEADIYHVIVKAATEANVYHYYVYEGGSRSDTYLIPPGTQAISHITFCGKEGIVVPEFPTLALPAALLVGMLGLVFAVRRKNE